jgi:hypothetical protein
MNHLLDNPVARHAGRLVTRRNWPWAVGMLLLVTAALGALLGRFWVELPDYALLRPQMWSGWLGLTLLAESMIVLPWAAVRGSLLWRRLRQEGHITEYRRSRMSAGQIVMGAILAAVYPPVALLLASLLLSLALAARPGGVEPGQVLTAHLLLLPQVLAFAALGLWLASKMRYPGLAIPLSALLLALTVTAVGLLNPFLTCVADPTPMIYWALLPNPVTAAGNVLDTDVLRFSWIYEHIRAHEYLYVYPPAWQTGGLYLGACGGLFGLLARGISRDETAL